MGFYQKPSIKDTWVAGSRYTAFTCSTCEKKWNHERTKLQCEKWDSRPNQNISEPE